MAMTPTYEISPGRGIGVFRLGDTLWHILELLRGSKTEYPKVEVSWDTEPQSKSAEQYYIDIIVKCPQRSAVIIHLPQLTLYFPHSPNQRLTQLTIPNLSQSQSLVLTYETQILSSATQPLTRAKVGKILGPTFSSAGGKLEYPGITFDLQSATGTGGREDLVRSLTVIPRPGSGDEVVQGEGKEAILESCIIIPDVGVDLLFSDQSTPIQLRIGETTAQDLLLDLGPPLRRFWKEDDRLERMWGGGRTASTVTAAAAAGQCFWNYFQYGLDVLVSCDDSHGDGGTILKIIAHSNIPGTPLFQRYARCPWTLPTPSGALDLTSTPNLFSAQLSSTNTLGSGYSGEDTQTQTINTHSTSTSTETHLAVPIPVTVTNGHSNGSSGKKKKSKNAASASGSGSTSPAVVGSFGDSDKDLVPTRIDKNKKGGSESERDVMGMDAMELDRVVEGGLEDVKNLGPSRLIGYDGLIIEQDIACGGICSVLVWRDECS